MTTESTVTIAYPSQFESDVVLRTGRTLHIRPIRPDDSPRLLTFFRALSAESLHSRFFAVRTPDAALRDTPSDVDYENEFGVIGELDDIIAVAHYYRSRSNPRSAEVAFTIADRAQGCGIGTRLLEKLADVARTKGIELFEAEVLPENKRMLDVFLCSGFDATSRTAEGAVHVSFPIRQTAEHETAVAARSQKAAWASMRAIFAPKSIAVVGASRRPGQLGTEIVHNLRSTGFTGSLFAVNPNAPDIEGVKAYPTLTAIEGDVDLAIIAVPAAHVEAVIDDCVAKGVDAIVVISAGFGETGEQGREAERRLVERVRAAGIRMVGPNCMGVINTDPAVNMHATFSGIYPPAGNVAMSSQSGALGLAILDYAKTLNIGFSTFISVGNKADVSGNDLIQYWAEDPNTDVMLLYLESFGNPRKFGEIARRVGRRKPIVAVKAGRSKAGARAASSHTGALATSDAIVTDLFRQAGVIRTETLEELFDVAALLANQPLPIGSRVAIMTNAGGPGILAADACEASGLELAQLSLETTAKLKALLPPAASTGNPVDMIASATHDQYRRTLELLLADSGVDSVIAIYIPVLPTDAPDVAAAIRDGADIANGKTIIATFMSARGLPAALSPVPSFAFPERAVNALARATAYAKWRRSPVGKTIEYLDMDHKAMRAIIDGKIVSGGGWLGPSEIQSLLRAAGIPTAKLASVTNVYDAVGEAMRTRFPVALKAQGAALLHKSEAGAVKLGLQDETEVRQAYLDLQTRLGDRMESAIVQQMIPGGVEVMIGATADPTFGHVVVYGAGGTLVELLADVSTRITPLTDTDADDMIEEVRSSKLLRGFRGSPAVDRDALRDVLLRTSALLTLCPEIRELDINPLKVLERGAAAVDARVRVEKPPVVVPTRRIAY